MMKDPEMIRQEILDRIEEHCGQLQYSPAENMEARLEQIRTVVQQHVDMLYNEGHIDRKPTAIVEWMPKTGYVEISFSWPVSCIEFTVNYSHNDGFKEANHV